MKDYNEYFLSNCIIAEHRRERPFISKDNSDCPFCLPHEKEAFVRIVPNKYPVVDEKSSPYGIHDVVIDTPYHLQHPKDFSKAHWEALLVAMQQRWHELCKDDKVQFIQIFKNYGMAAGASISHSHSQILALENIPYGMTHQYIHYNMFKEEPCYLCHLASQKESTYLIMENEAFIVIAPDTPVFAYETWLIPKKHHKHYGELSQEEVKSCGLLLKRLLEAYDLLEPDCAFNICFMSGGLHNTLDYHFYIKLVLRIGNIAGFEIATHCTFNMIHPKSQVKHLKNILKE